MQMPLLQSRLIRRIDIRDTSSAPTQDQIDRAKVLCNDLLEVLRQEWSKARDAMNNQHQHHGGGYQQQGYGGYQGGPGQQQGGQGQAQGQDAYAAYYAVSFISIVTDMS